jgi:hypothetical protein
MTEGPIPALRALPMGILGDLARALRSGHLPQEASSFMIRYSVPSASELAAAELSSLLAAGVSLYHTALVLDIVAAERRSGVRRAEMELVTSGPDNSGSTRDTGVVLRESFSQVENRILIVGFAVHQGRDIFAFLADRMCQRPDLAVRLCIDIHRAPGDTTTSAALLRRFAQRFIRDEWPGPRLPEVFTILGAW